MNAVETLQLLRGIQELDSAITELTRQRDAVPAALRSVMREIDGATKALENERLAQKKLKARIDELDTTVKMAESRIADLRQKQNAAKTNKEYAAFDLDIENQQLAIGNAEEAELATMQELEAQNDRVAAAEKELAKHSAARDAQQAVLDDKVSAFNEKIDERRQRLDSLRAQLDEDTLEAYDDIRTYRAGVAVSAVGPDRICQGCQTMILPDKMYELSAGTKLVHCDQCNRFLYLADAAAS